MEVVYPFLQFITLSIWWLDRASQVGMFIVVVLMIDASNQVT